jgi:hypothetical protein
VPELRSHQPAARLIKIIEQRGQAPLPDLFFFQVRESFKSSWNEQVRKRGLPPLFPITIAGQSPCPQM